METTTDKILNKIDEWGNSFFLRLENMNTNELVVVVLGGTVALLTYGKMKSGLMHSPLYTLFGICKPRTELTGYVKKGYEKARDEMQKLLDEGMEENIQACAYVNGELVLDLVGVINKDHDLSRKYNAATIQNVFSSSKAVSSIAVAMLVDRGHLRYDMKIVDVWPEFGKHGKDSITLEELLKHEAGLEKFPFSLTAEDLYRENLKDPRSQVGAKIANAKSSRPPDVSGATMPRVYHAVTRDIIVNEIVLRTDPQRRTLGEFIRDEIATPLNITEELTMGKETTQNADKIYPLTGLSRWWIFLQLFNRWKPKVALGDCIFQLFVLNMGIGYKVAKLIKGENYAVPSFVAGKGENPFMEIDEMYNHPTVRNCEAPSSNMHANARGLARLASIMAGDGSAHGVTLLSPNTVLSCHEVSPEDVKFDSFLNARTKFNKGGWNVFDSNNFAYNRHGMVGWFGIGGSVVMWQRELNIGFGWANSLMVANAAGKNAVSVQNAVTLCAKKLLNEKKS